MKQKIKNLIAAVIFLSLAFELFIHCTYLFRNTDRAARQNILGLYYEENDSLDVVCVGPSSVYRYWSPMKAWDLYGFTSYNFSVSAMSRATILTAIRDLRRTQSPAVIVIDVRPFLNMDTLSELGSPERNTLDSLDYSLIRLQGVKYLSDNSDIPEQEIGSEYMELAQYHNNKSALAGKLNWQLIDNRLNSSPDGEGFYKGFAIAAKHTYQSKEAVHLTDETAENVSELYMDILEYGKEKNLTFLFVASPLAVSEQESEILNKMESVAKEYGYGFLDGNRFCDEMNLDFRTDFYNKSHVNILGAEKWTEFVGNYLIQNYELPDHRNDGKFDSWNIAYEAYKQEAENAASQTLAMIQNHDAALENEKLMRQTDSLVLWFQLANNENISVLVCVDSCADSETSIENKEILKSLGIDESRLGTGRKYYALYSNRTVHSYTTTDAELNGTIGELDIPFTIRKADTTKVIVQNEEYNMPEGKIHLLAFDNNLNQFVDFIEIGFSENGDAELKHSDYNSNVFE